MKLFWALLAIGYAVRSMTADGLTEGLLLLDTALLFLLLARSDRLGR